jgi:hypothetical protein
MKKTPLERKIETIIENPNWDTFVKEGKMFWLAMRCIPNSPNQLKVKAEWRKLLKEKESKK